MIRYLLAAALVFVGVGAASADYVLIKINLNKLNFHPEAISIPGFGQPPGAGGTGPAGPQNPGGLNPGMPGAAAPQAPAEDPNARWIYAYVEIKGKAVSAGAAMAGNAPVLLAQVDHHWGTKNWFPIPGPNSKLPQVVIWPQPAVADPLKDFAFKLQQKKANKDKSIEPILDLARLALQHGSMKQFHRAMAEAVEANPKHGVVQQYVRVKKELARPLDEIDPTQRDILQDLAENKYHVKVSDQKHYAMHYLPANASDRMTDTIVKRRLAMMESTLETFYYWFAMQRENSVQPPMPRYRFQVILAKDKEEFFTRNLQWGSEPLVGDGFAPRRDNIVILSAKLRISDPLYEDFDKLITTKLNEVNLKLLPFGINVTRDDLLSGKINENKFAKLGAVPIAYAQVAVLLGRTLEDEAERLTISNETVRQILISSQVFPRHVQIPDWMVEGLSAFFESSPGIYPNIGSKSWTHLVSYKHLRNVKDPRLQDSAYCLFNVVTDRFFQEARQKSANLRQSPNNNDFRLAASDAWEVARCTSWAFVYFLAQTKKLDSLFKYGGELDKLPRDMDLTYLVIQGCFARAFEMTDIADPRRIDQSKLASLASAWATHMQETNLDNIKVQEFLLQMRASQDSSADTASDKGGSGDLTAASTGGSGSEQGKSLAGSTWHGNENLPGGGKIGFSFQQGGSVAITKNGNFTGTYTQDNDKVTITAGMITYTGTIQGNTISGTATNGQATWNFTVSRGGPGPGQGPNPGLMRPNAPKKGKGG